jgi:uncharacterized cupin superfamily protein
MAPVNIAEPQFAYDPQDPDGFRSGAIRIGEAAGAQRSGTSVYEIPPGQAICPYHYHYGEEEWLIALRGHPTLRTPDGEQRLEPWDAVCFPEGPDGSHSVRNETPDPVRVLMYSTVAPSGFTVYPDSAKIGVWSDTNPQDSVMLSRARGAATYYDGEL